MRLTNGKNVNDALDSLSRVYQRQVWFNNGYSIPFVFGLSVDGRTIYFDRDMPRYFTSHGCRIDNYDLLAKSELLRRHLVSNGIDISDANDVCAVFEMRYVFENLGIKAETYAVDFLSKYTYDGGWDFYRHLPPDFDVSDLGLSEEQESEMNENYKYHHRSNQSKLLTSPLKKRKKKNVGNLHKVKLSGLCSGKKLTNK